MMLDLVERAPGERGGDHRHHRQVGGAQDLVSGVGHAGRAIDDDPIIVAGEVGRDLGQPLALAEVVEGMFEVAQRLIGRQQVEPLDRGRADQLRRVGIANDAAFGLVAAGRFMAKDIGRGRLGIEVPQQGAARLDKVALAQARLTASVVFPTPPLAL